MVSAVWAERVAATYLHSLPRRWAHTQGVARQARTLASILGQEAELVEAAAWLHDVGYSPELYESGFHPLDGARYLRNREHADPRLCRLVAHHSEALVEAAGRGLDQELAAEFDVPPQELAEALAYCDMTTAPDGRQTTVEQRLTEIADRYGDDDVVGHSIRQSGPRLVAATHAVQRQMAVAGGPAGQ